MGEECLLPEGTARVQVDSQQGGFGELQVVPYCRSIKRKQGRGEVRL